MGIGGTPQGKGCQVSAKTQYTGFCAWKNSLYWSGTQLPDILPRLTLINRCGWQYRGTKNYLCYIKQK
jgi:hypothetical protein